MNHAVLGKRAHVAASYQMITNLSVDNFRCFDHLSLGALKPITIITGASGSGKTALLEALLIAAKGHPDAVVRANRVRAVPESMAIPQPLMAALPMILQGSFPILPQAFQSSWASLFGDISKPVGMTFSDSSGVERSLTIAFENSTSPASPSSMPSDGGQSKRIVFNRMIADKQEQPLYVFLNQNNQMEFSGTVSQFGPTLFYFQSTAQFSETDNVSWFSDLRVSGKADGVVDMVRSDFPFIRDLQVLSPAGATGVYAIMQDGSVRSLSLVSSGIHKMFSLYCGISDLSSGVMLLDEIENGVYYERYISLWRHLYKMTTEKQNQIFVTTHSEECLKALEPVLEEDASNVTLLRTERHENRCSVRQISGKAVRAALRGDIDLRGSI